MLRLKPESGNGGANFSAAGGSDRLSSDVSGIIGKDVCQREAIQHLRPSPIQLFATLTQARTPYWCKHGLVSFFTFAF